MQTLSKLVRLLEPRQKRIFALFTLLCLFSPVVDLYGVSRFIPVIQQALQPNASEGMMGQVVFLAFILLMVGVFNLLKSRCSSVLVMDIAQGWSLKIYALLEEEKLGEHNKKTFFSGSAGHCPARFYAGGAVFRAGDCFGDWGGSVPSCPRRGDLCHAAAPAAASRLPRGHNAGQLQYASKYYEELKMALDRYD